MTRTLFILGATGFIGRATVASAIAAGWRVTALARADEGVARLHAAGARPVLGDVARPDAWIDEARGATALIDLVQPKLPTRMSRSAIAMVSRERQAGAAGILTALRALPAAEQPLLFSISGSTTCKRTAAALSTIARPCAMVRAASAASASPCAG